MTRTNEFREVIRSALKPLRSPVKKAMKALFKRKYPKEARILWFEIHSDIYDFPVHVFAMDREAINDVYDLDPITGEVVLGINEDLLPDLGREYVSQEVFDSFSDEDVPEGTYEVAALTIARFLHECFVEAGGKALKLRAFAAHHDRSRTLNLKSGRWLHREDLVRS